MEWISIKERLPENSQMVICYNGYIVIKIYDNSIFYDGDYHWSGKPIGKVEPTHWLPLPEKPTE
jgi:hypothetical protein